VEKKVQNHHQKRQTKVENLASRSLKMFQAVQLQEHRDGEYMNTYIGESNDPGPCKYYIEECAHNQALHAHVLHS